MDIGYSFSSNAVLNDGGIPASEPPPVDEEVPKEKMEATPVRSIRSLPELALHV